MQNAGDKLKASLMATADIPMLVWQHWPAFFSFSLVNYISGMVLMSVPQVGGYAGLVERAAIQGAVQVLDHVTWDVLSHATYGERKSSLN